MNQSCPPTFTALSRCQYRHLRRREPTSDLTRIVADLVTIDPSLARDASRPATRTSGDGGRYAVDAHGAIGVQIGDGNIQHVDTHSAPAQPRQPERS
jgi:hypothetical protein